MSRFLEKKALPTFWCEGCGTGIVLGAIVRALDASGADPEKTVVVTGIGCSGKLDDYVSCHTVHGTHGRALPIATGIKAANPDLTVVAVLGDGDGATIGGNHLLHSARRNIGVLAILVNNFNYGMTGGQYSGTTPEGSRTSTSPYGDPEPGMDLCKVVSAAGADYVARSTVYHVAQLEKQIRDGMKKQGFAFIEAVSTCPTYFGRWNGKAAPVEMLLSLKDRAVPVGRGSGTGAPGLEGTFEIGVFQEKGEPGFSERYVKVQELAASRATKKAVATPTPATAAPEGGKQGASHWEIVLAGSGGQGLGVAGLLLGQAATEYDGKQSSQTQAYGTAARGGFAKSEVIVSDREIMYPGVTRPNAVVAISQIAYDRYAGKLPDGSLFIYDSGEVKPEEPVNAGGLGFPISAAAREMGEPQSANLVAIGVLIGVTKAMSVDSVERAIAVRFSGKEGPLLAFRKGLQMAGATKC